MAMVSGPRKGGASNAVAWSVPHMPYTDEASDMIFHAPCMRCADYAAFHVASAAAIPNAEVSSYIWQGIDQTYVQHVINKLWYEIGHERRYWSAASKKCDLAVACAF